MAGINPLRQYIVLLVAFLICVVSIIPIILTSTVPLQDYPAHMARMYVLLNLDNNTILQQIYQIKWEFIPNLAMDLILPPLTKVLPLFLAGEIIVMVTVVLWITGPVILHYALFGSIGYWPLIASFYTYNQCLLFGFVNFNFGAGLSFFAMALWVLLQNRPMNLRVVIFSILATILFFCHFISFVIYGLAIIGYETVRLYQDGGFRDVLTLTQRLSVVSAQFAIPVLIFLFLSPTGGELVPTAGIRWGGVEGRLSAIRSTIWFENGVFDYLAFAFTAGVFLYGLGTGSLSFNKPFLGSLAVLSIVALLTPMGLDGPGLRHIRVPPVLAALFFAGTRWREGTVMKFAPLVIALGVGIFLSRTVSTAVRWRALDAQIAEFRDASSVIAEGASLFLVTVGPTGQEFRHADGGSLLHLADYATIDRSAFVPSVFADPGVQPIHQVDHYWKNYGRVSFLNARWESLPALALESADAPHTLAGWQDKYDYVVALNLWQLNEEPIDCLTRVHSGSFFSIYEVARSGDHPAACGAE